MPPSYLNPRFHVVIVLGKDAGWIESCLSAVLSQTLPPGQVTVFDNLATSGLAEWLPARFPQVRLMRSPRDLGFAAGANRAVASMREADFVTILDPDMVPALNVLERLAEAFAQHPRVGVFGCKVLDRDVETLHHAGLRLTANALPDDIGRGEPDRDQYQGVNEVPAVQTAAMALRAEVWPELNGFDEDLGPAYYEGIDFCFRAARAGWKVAVAGDATVTHFNPWAPRRRDPQGLELFFRSRARFLLKHYHARDWLTRYLPGELRWLADLESKGMRARALRTLGQAALERLRRPHAGKNFNHA